MGRSGERRSPAGSADDPGSAPGLELRELEARFGDVVAVAGVSMVVEEGEFLCLLGPSGCGKTSILRTVAGFLDPSGGSVSVRGQVLSAPGRVVRPEARGMSMVFQNYALWPHMTVFKNVAYGLRVEGVDAQTTRQRVMRILETVQLGELADRYPPDLSGGQQQRVALARALVVEPKVLLMDEPLSNLDATLREDMRFQIRRLQEEFGVTAVYVTHDLEEAMVVADRIAVMNRGRIEQLGSPQDIYEAPASAFVAGFIGQTSFLEATGMAGNEVSLKGGLTLRTAAVSEGVTQGRPVTVAVRPHDIAVRPAAGGDPSPATAGDPLAPTATSDNRIPGTVQEVYYFGRSWDMMVRLDGGDAVVRVSVAPDQRFEVGQQVELVLPADKCKVVPDVAVDTDPTPAGVAP